MRRLSDAIQAVKNALEEILGEYMCAGVSFLDVRGDISESGAA